MRIGCPTEIKAQEYRVGLTPHGAREAVGHGHEVLIEAGAGKGAGFKDADYEAAGAKIVPTREAIFTDAEMVVKVKEPLREERALLRDGQILFTFLHLAPDRQQTDELIASGATCIAYETVTGPAGGLPLLLPMSEVAGRLAPQKGAWALQNANGGRGVLMAGVPGVTPADVVVIGGGVVGTNAARVAAGMGARVTVLDLALPRLKALDDQFGHLLATRHASAAAIEEHLGAADLVIGAVLIPGAEAPKVIRRDHLASMRPGAVIVDVAIDQGGCAETSRATTHADPIYEVDGIVHYCVANMPGAVSRTSTFALGNATLQPLLTFADMGWQAACRADTGLAAGINVSGGRLTNEAIAKAQSRDWTPVADLLSA